MIKINTLAAAEQKATGTATYKSFPHCYQKNGLPHINAITHKQVDFYAWVDGEDIEVETIISNPLEIAERIKKHVSLVIKNYTLFVSNPSRFLIEHDIAHYADCLSRWTKAAELAGIKID